jgi:DNA-binding response OmpR family regulator
VARIVAVTPDLLLGSRIEAALSAAGHDVTVATELANALLDDPEAIVADLDAGDPGALVGHEVPVLGYYSHVNAETRQAAEEAGVDLIVPRSRLARELPELVERLLSDGIRP